MRTLTSFEQSLIDEASREKEAYLASGKQCCFRCRFSQPPDHPDHASHYVLCAWQMIVPQPVCRDFGVSPALVGIAQGRSCKTFEAKP